VGFHDEGFGIAWFALLLISHDRQFMDAVVSQVHEIAEKWLIAYTGNYSDYLLERAARYDQQLAAYNNQQKEIAALQQFADRFRSVTSKASQAMSKLKQIERMDTIEKPLAPRRPFRFQIPQPPRGGQRAVSLKGIHMAYGANRVYEGMDLAIERGEQTVLVGPNGAGKSTLLKILAGVVEFQKGERDLGHNAKVGYFSQHRAATLDPEWTVLEEVTASAPLMREEEARAGLGSFMFRKDDIYKLTKVLSGGEKTRLNLIRFLVDPPNLLLMDELTTHLDIHTVESLTLALERYEGTLVFISHDVHFIRKLATKVLHVNAGQITSYVGGYDYFLEKNRHRGRWARRAGCGVTLNAASAVSGIILPVAYRFHPHLAQNLFGHFGVNKICLNRSAIARSCIGGLLSRCLWAILSRCPKITEAEKQQPKPWASGTSTLAG
jgi:ATP-binding cassette subfamily F protein 3